jgi:hypothetical protein
VAIAPILQGGLKLPTTPAGTARVAIHAQVMPPLALFPRNHHERENLDCVYGLA